MGIFCAIFCFVLCSLVDARGYSKRLTVRNGGRWGSWSNDIGFCPEGRYAIGFEKKVEDYQGNRDDTALNGIRLICGNWSGISDRSYANSAVGPWGRWTEEVRCNEGHFISAFSLKVEPYQGWQAWKDDTAANNMKIRCRGFDDESLLYENIEPNRNEWGTYGIWSDNCGPNSAVCGIQTKIEQPQGNGDDTALNDLALYCC